MSFPSTRHSVIERLRGSEDDTRRDAFGDLVSGYWKPIYKYLRLTWRLSDENAQDLTQAFFSDAYQKAWLERYEPGKARFRTFVRLCADRFVMNWKQSASRVKRGGASELVSLDFDSRPPERRRLTAS
jgi:DNA-directed RNA polymerase specialized sigma24 family protein